MADPLRVLVKTPLSPYSGYGNDGLGIVRALVEAGADVYLDPSHVSAPLPPLVANLLTKPLAAPFDLLIHHADPMQLGITPQARRAATITVAWTMWEFSNLLNCPLRSTLRRRLQDYDLVLGYDTVSTGALAPYITRSKTKLETLQGGFWPQQWPEITRDWISPRFGYAMVGQLHQRKEPFLAITAFDELKKEHPDEFEPAELHLKSSTPGLHSAMEQWVPKLKIYYAVWPENVLYEFYGAQHVLLAPSRGEGKNMPALEFLSTGGTVIATAWGGHEGWLSPAIGYPLDYVLRPVDADKPTCLNARASKDHLKELMLHVFRNRGEAAAKGELASSLIPQMCSWTVVLRRLFDKLSQVPGAGPLVHAARAAEPSAVDRA